MKLSIVEKFLLLAQHPEKGWYITGDTQVVYGLIGALLMQMSLANRFKMESKKLILCTEKKSENAIFADIEMRIAKKKPRKVKTWISSLANKSRKYRIAIQTEMMSKRLIRVEQKKFLGLIPYRRVYLVETKTRNALIHDLKRAILSKHKMDDETISLLAIINASDMHKIFAKDRAERKHIKKELKKLVKENPIANSLSQSIMEVQAAIAASVTAVSVATVSGH